MNQAYTFIASLNLNKIFNIVISQLSLHSSGNTPLFAIDKFYFSEIDDYYFSHIE